jgi:predicted TIM-barrel fold metal-dependent hydrolase
MLVDTHTNLGWYPDHFSEEFVEFALAAKLAKMKRSPDVYFAADPASMKNAFDSTPEALLKATAKCDKVIVFGLVAPFAGISIPQEIIHNFVQQHSDRFVGWCSVDPNDKDCIDQLEHYVTKWNLRGLKLGPIYQNFNPADPRHLPLFRKAEKLGIPVIIHMATSFVRAGPLKYSNPMLLEDVAVACPDLRIIISHLGHPWEADCVVLIRKHPNLYANISALHYRPWRHWQAFITALEYGVENKLIFGSDFPSATPEQLIAGLHKVNDIVEGSKLPKFPREVIDQIIYENWKQVISF